MGKVILVLVAALAAAFFFEGPRGVILERAKPLLDPYFVMSTGSEMEKIIVDLQAYQRDNMNRIPDRREFPSWLESQYAGGADRDAWGTPYQYVVGREEYSLRSAGPDRMFQTEDDIVEARRLLRAR